MAVWGLLADSRRIPQIRLEVRENKTEIWEASQGSFDGCWPLSLITQSSVSGGRRMQDFIFLFLLTGGQSYCEHSERQRAENFR